MQCLKEQFTKFKKKTCKIFNACYTMKEGVNGKNYVTTMIPKAFGVQKKKIFFNSIPKETKNTDICWMSSL